MVKMYSCGSMIIYDMLKEHRVREHSAKCIEHSERTRIKLYAPCALLYAVMLLHILYFGQALRQARGMLRPLELQSIFLDNIL